MKKWFKRDLKLLRDQLEHFVTFNALYRSPEEEKRMRKVRSRSGLYLIPW